MKEIRKWEADEVIKLIQLYNKKMPSPDMEAELNRTDKSIARKLNSLRNQGVIEKNTAITYERQVSVNDIINGEEVYKDNSDGKFFQINDLELAKKYQKEIKGAIVKIRNPPTIKSKDDPIYSYGYWVYVPESTASTGNQLRKTHNGSAGFVYR